MSKTIGYAAHNPKAPLVPFNFERREVGPQDVQIEILYCGVCHSDLHQVCDDWASSTYPIVPGHEIVGRVLKVGSDVKEFKAGDLAGVGCLVDSCRVCADCKEHLEQFCDSAVFTYNSHDKHTGKMTYGGYSRQIVVDKHYVLHISDKLDLAAPLESGQRPQGGHCRAGRAGAYGRQVCSCFWCPCRAVYHLSQQGCGCQAAGCG